MASNSTLPGNSPPPKPWERAGSSSGPSPFKPPSSGGTSDVVEASGTAKPGEIVSTDRTTAQNRNAIVRPGPSRPWEQNYGNTYGGNGYSSYGGFGGSYGGGLYGNSTYRGYGGLYEHPGMYGSMYNNNFGGPVGGYGMGMGSPYSNRHPNNPYGPPLSPPGFWMSFLRVMHGVVDFFGRISILTDQNTQAFHMFMTALLQLFDRSGMLYGELARFVLRLFGIRTRSRKQCQLEAGQLPTNPDAQGQHYIEGPKATSDAV